MHTTGRFSTRLAAVALVAAVLAPASVAAAQTTGNPTGASAPAITCGAPPAGVTATPSDRDRFVGLWAPRVNDAAFIQGFIDAPAVPESIQAEGFHRLDALTQGWLIICLVDRLIATVGLDGNPPGSVPPPARLDTIRAALGLVIFGKAGLARLQQQARQVTPVTDPGPSPTQQDVTAATQRLSTTAVPLPPDTSTLVPSSPALDAVTDLTSTSTQTLTDLLAGNPQTVAVQAGLGVQAEVATPVGSVDVGLLLATGLNGTIAFPVVGRLVQLVERLLQNVTNLVGNLLARPPLNVLGGATYRVCRESADLPLACTVPIPVGTPVPVGLTADLVPDILAHLSPQPNLFALQDVTAGFTITRLPTAPPGPLPFHVFAVYDPPFTGKRLEFGVDGRASTIADRTNIAATVKNVFSNLAADLNVQLSLTHQNPGASEALTVALKSLVSQGNLKPGKEEDPLAGAIQFTPVPTNLTADLRLRRSTGTEQTTITINSSVTTLVEAQVNRDLTTTTPKSHQEIRGRIQNLPTSATVDLIRQATRVNVHYFASAPIELVSVADKSVPDVSKPTTYNQGLVNLFGVPSDVKVTLTGGNDILYVANAVVPKVQVSTGSFKDGVLQSSILGTVEGVPKSIHVNIQTGGDTTAGTYDADSSLAKAQVVMYDKASDETLLTATATSFPTHIGLSATKSNGVLDYSANGPIATIDAKITRQGGSTLALTGDHASVLKEGTKLGAALFLSGLQAFRVEPSQKSKYSLTLNPGGQAFKAVADLDTPNVSATVDISNLPPNIAVTMDPAAGSATYSADAVVNKVTARFEERTKQMLGLAELEGIPQTVSLTWNTTGATPGLTYSASGKLTKLRGVYIEKPGGTSFDATIESLPEWFRVAGSDPFSFDARTAANAAPASSSIGKMTFKYTSNGTFATSPTSDDHVILITGTATQAELAYSGLRSISASTANKELHVELKNTAKRDFRAYLDSPQLIVEGLIKGVPDSIKFDLVGQTGTYTAGSTVDQVAVDIDRRNGEKLAVDITSIPSSITLTMDANASTVNWVASAAAGGVGIVAKFGPPTLGGTRTVDSSLTLTGIPAQWKVAYGVGHPKFEGVTGAIGSIAASFTNHGTVTVPTGDHLSAVFNQTSGDLDASIKISKLSLAEFEKLADGFKADLKMGDGSPFALNANVNLGTTVATVTGTLSNLPTDVHLESAGGQIKYTGNTNPSFQLSAAYGTPAGLAATPTPPSVHGLAARDGQGTSMKANLYLTGMPKELDFNPKTGVYLVKGFAPTADLVIDAKLDDIVSSALSLLVTQAGIPANGVDFTFGPTTTSTLGDGTVKTHAGYTATKAMGKLTATASFGSDEAYFETSAVPQSLSIDLSMGPDTKTVGISLGTAITLLKALYRHVGDSEFAAGVELGDVPTTVSLTIGKKDGGQGVTLPTFEYHASDAGLDLTAYAKASLFSGNVNARVDLKVVNFGKDVTGTLNDKTLTITSTPATASFNLLASGRLKFDIDLAFTAGPIKNTGNLNLDLRIFELNLAFTNLNSLTLKGGVTSSIEGDYGSFTLGEKSDLKLALTDKVVIDAGVAGTITLVEINPPINVEVGNVVGNFRLATNHEDVWLTAFSSPVPCRVQADPPDVDFYTVDVDLRPHPHSTTAGPSFTVNGADGEGSPKAHIITPNPKGLIPNFVLDVIARFASPLGGGQSLGTSCPD